MSKEEKSQLSTICRQLKLEAADGKMRETDAADMQGIFRIIQSIPSPKAEHLTRMSTAKRTWMYRIYIQYRHGGRLSESEAMFRHSRNSCSPFDTDVKHKPDMDVRGSK